jgi:phosphoglucosamine mutase
VVAQVESRLAGAGRIVLRPSGTEPLIRVMVEGREEPLARACAEQIAEAVRTASG